MASTEIVPALAADSSRQTAAVVSPQRLTLWELISYSLPAASTSLIVVPLTAIFPNLYEKYYGVPFAALGPALLASRLIDTVLDPITAYLSDKTKTRLGARKPWMIAGALTCVIGVYFLFLPQQTPDAFYFFIWSTVTYIGWTLISIPHGAWGAEISGNYDERSRIASVAGIVGSVGTVMFLAAPIVLPFDTEDISPGVIRAVGIISIIFIPLSVGLASWFAPAGKQVASFETNLFGFVRGMWLNKPFRLFLAIFVLQGIALGIYSNLLFVYVDGYLKIGQLFARILIFTTIANLVSIPLWLWACNKFGKHLPWAVGSLSTNLVIVGYLFVPPGEAAYWPTLVISVLYGLLSSCAAVCFPSIMADIVDYGTLKTGSNRAGSYFAVVMFCVKGTAAVGAGLATTLIGLFGFSSAAGVVNSDFANFGMLFVFIGLHTLLQMAAIPLIWQFPIDKRRQTIIRTRIERRAARAERDADQMTSLP